MSKHLQRLIAQGEHQQQDFKYAINDSRKIAKSLVAFANTDGGRLLIGVKDNGTIAGVSGDEEYYMVEAAAELYCRPPIPFTVIRHETKSQKTVLEVQIEPSPRKPHFAQTDDQGWLAYIRIDDKNILANKVQINVWRQQSSPRGALINYTDAQRMLLQYLSENEQISLSKFARMAKLPFRKAERVLVELIVSNVIGMQFTDQGVVYKLVPKKPENEQKNKK